MDKTWQLLVDGKRYDVTPNLRFIERDGIKVLQQMLMIPSNAPYREGDEDKLYIWHDVSLVKE